MCQMFTLLLIASSFFLMNTVIVLFMLPPPSLIVDINSIWYPHNLSPLNYYGSYCSTIFPPSVIMAPMGPHSVPLNSDDSYVSTLFTSSIMMAPIESHYVPLNDDGSYFYTLCPPQWVWILWIHTLPHSFMMAFMTDYSLYPLTYYGSIIMKIIWWGALLWTKGLMAWFFISIRSTWEESG